MHHRPRLRLLALPAILLLAFAALPLTGCASDRPNPDAFVVLADRDFPGTSFDHMFTLSQRTMRDLRLSRRTISKNERDAMLIFYVAEAEYREMAFQIRPEGTSSSHVTLLGKPLRIARDQLVVDRIMDNLNQQIAFDKDPMLAMPKAPPSR
ncbi:MAG: hypothetical protein NTW19_25415 [Planctomycetota bacterium]|nr:hypothetical protein [Planctomycetota bacterium]